MWHLYRTQCNLDYSRDFSVKHLLSLSYLQGMFVLLRWHLYANK